jgi:hypothetical protein
VTQPPRFGLRVIRVEQINTDEMKFFRERRPGKLKQSIQTHSLWQPLFVEVIQEDKEYILVDGFRRLKIIKEILKWGVVECIVTHPTSFEERQLRRLGMHTFTKEFSAYDTHCALYALKQAGTSDQKILEYSGLSAETTMSYLNNLHLPLRDVLEGQLHSAPYEGWTKVLGISDGLLSQHNLDWLKQAVLTRQCSGYQVDGIIEAINKPQFQGRTEKEQHQLLQDMILLTKNSRRDEKLTAAELVGLEFPQSNKAVHITLNSVKMARKLLQPHVLHVMKSDQLREVYTAAKDLKKRIESIWSKEDFGEELLTDGPAIH